MALKLPQDEIKNKSIKEYDNPDVSRQDNTAEKRKKLRKRNRSQQFYELDSEIINNITLNKPEMGSYYDPNYVIPNYSVPYTYQWDVITPQINQLYTVPVPTVPLALIFPPLPIIPTLFCRTRMSYTPTYPAVVPYVADNICTALDHVYEQNSSFAALTPVTLTDEDHNETVEEHDAIESLEYYLTLPKDLFPKAKMLTLDPNPIIDELCKIKDINKHSPWILDLEFGVPRTPLSRPLAVYDMQFNNIHCKNTPGTVHPLFEACSEEFKRPVSILVAKM